MADPGGHGDYRVAKATGLQGGLVAAAAELAADPEGHEDYRAAKTAGLRAGEHPDLIRCRDGVALWMSATTGRVQALQVVRPEAVAECHYRVGLKLPDCEVSHFIAHGHHHKLDSV